jgi:hypothetical protein
MTPITRNRRRRAYKALEKVDHEMATLRYKLASRLTRAELVDAALAFDRMIDTLYEGRMAIREAIARTKKR